MDSQRCIFTLVLSLSLILSGYADSNTTYDNTTELYTTELTSASGETTTELISTTEQETEAWTSTSSDPTTVQDNTTTQSSSTKGTEIESTAPTTGPSSSISIVFSTEDNTSPTPFVSSTTASEDTTIQEAATSTTDSGEITTTNTEMPVPEEGNRSVVVMLGTLLAFFMVLFVLLFLYTIMRRRKLEYANRAGQQAYDNTEMEFSADGIERIRETDIRVVTDPLGEGRFGEIFPGQIQRGTRKVEVAFKTLKPGSSDLERGGFMAQLSLYNRLEPHPHVIQFFGLCSVGDQVFAAFEFAANGNLRNFLRRNGMPESEASSPVITLNKTMLLNFAHEVALGMQYLASKKIVHRELMSRHVLVTADCSCKVAGLNETQRSEKNYHIRWMAPECLETGNFSPKSDVWAFGILLWEVITMGGQPYPDIASKELPVLLQQEYIMPIPENCEPVIYGIMKQCWENDPTLRPEFGELSTKIKMTMETADVNMNEEEINEMAIDIEGLDEQ